MSLLIDGFLRNYEDLLRKVPYDELAIAPATTLAESVHAAEKVFFSKSTIKMLLEKMDDFTEIYEEVRARLPRGDESSLYNIGRRNKAAVWLEFEEDIQTPPLNVPPTAALFCWVPRHWMKSGNDYPTLYIISRDKFLIAVISCKRDKPWLYDGRFDICGTDLWTQEEGFTVHCPYCGIFLCHWAEIIILSAILAGQHLAEIRYEERIVQSFRRVQRQHSNKKKTVPTHYRVKVIDASEILLPAPLPEPLEEPIETQPRPVPIVQGSWLEEAKAIDDLEYIELTTRPFTRHYRHPRFVNMQGKTTDFPNGVHRRQPVRKSFEENRITKVVARKYEEKT